MIDLEITLSELSTRLKNEDNILILSHASPDGDTVGSAFALMHALLALNKKVRIECADEFPKKFSYIYDGITFEEFEPSLIVSVDVADNKLLGKNNEKYGNIVDICIDHHGSNTHFAKEYLVVPSAAATAEVIYDIVLEMGVTLNSEIAASLYTGISTDTGCFKFANTTAKTHKIAARLMETGINFFEINKINFDTKTLATVKIQAMAMSALEFHLNNRLAIMTVTNEMKKNSGAIDSEFDDISGLPRQIEGVFVGVTIREKENDRFKVSVRTYDPINASQVCSSFGGGGHIHAAGCEFVAVPLEQIKQRLIEVIKTQFDANFGEN